MIIDCAEELNEIVFVQGGRLELQVLDQLFEVNKRRDAFLCELFFAERRCQVVNRFSAS